MPPRSRGCGRSRRSWAALPLDHSADETKDFGAAGEAAGQNHAHAGELLVVVDGDVELFRALRRCGADPGDKTGQAIAQIGADRVHPDNAGRVSLTLANECLSGGCRQRRAGKRFEVSPRNAVRLADSGRFEATVPDVAARIGRMPVTSARGRLSIEREPLQLRPIASDISLGAAY